VRDPAGRGAWLPARPQRKDALTLVESAPVDLRQAAEPLHETLDRSVKFSEVLFDASVGHLRDGLGLDGFDRGTQLAHVASFSNMRSLV
jgi:hypothetical protein